MHELVQTILTACGGSDNIRHCGNCMTRLRLSLREQSKVKRSTLEALPAVMGVLESEGQLQIVLGPGKAQRAAEALKSLLSSQNTDPTPSLEQIAQDHKQTLKARHSGQIRSFLQTFATIFTPLLPGFIAAGVLMGFATLIEQIWITDTPDASTTLISLITFMKIFGTGLFAFLGILIGYNTQQAFGGSGVNGAILASLFLLSYTPATTGPFQAGLHDFFGFPIDPRGNIIGILLAAFVGAFVEKHIRRVMPDSLDMIVTPLLTLLICSGLTYLLIMPIGVWLFDGMSWLFAHLGGNPLGTAVLAGVFLLAVMFGVHQGFVPVYFVMMETQGFNSLFPVLAMAGAGQVGAALALYARARRSGILRQQIRGAILPGFLGVGEPLIYGITLPRLKPFVTACLGGSVGGFIIGLFAFLGFPMGLNTVFGPSGLVALPLMTSHQGSLAGMGIYLLGLLGAYSAGFILTWFWGCRNVDLA